MNARQILINTHIKNNGDWYQTYEDLKNKYFAEGETGEETGYYGKVITYMDENYPDRLKQITRPPLVLFYEGNIDLLNDTDYYGIAYDGDRNVKWKLVIDENIKVIMTENKYALEIAQHTKNPILVSKKSLNRVDTELKETILNNGGLIITELPNGLNPTSPLRIISGLEKHLIAIRVLNQGAGLIQLMNSLNNGHDIYCLPNDLEDTECRNNNFINEGAILLYDKSQLTGD